MINDVLDLSRIESGNLRLQTTTLDLAELVEATTALVASDAAKRGIRISVELAAGTSAVFGDADAGQADPHQPAQQRRQVQRRQRPGPHRQPARPGPT